MHLRDRLRRVDDRLIPPIASALLRLGRGARRLRVIRAAAIVLAVALVLVAVFLVNRTPRTVRAAGAVAGMGVPVGGSIPAYVAHSKSELLRLVAGQAGQATTVYGLVSLSAYRTPSQLAPLIGGSDVQVVAVFVHVRSGLPTRTYQIPTAAVPGDVLRGMSATAAQVQRDLAVVRARDQALAGSSETDRAVRAQYRVDEQVDMLEATQYRSSCACVFAVLVYASPATLARLAGVAGVRAVEAAPPGTVPGTFQPPLPEQSGVASPPTTVMASTAG